MKQAFFFEYGKSSAKFLDYLRPKVSEPNSGIVGVFIFNEIPTSSQINDISKLSRRHEGGVKLVTFFHKRFRNVGQYDFSYYTAFNRRVSCVFEKKPVRANFFLLLNEGQIVVATQDLNFKDIHFFFLRYRYPDRKLSHYFMNRARYKEHLLSRFANRALQIFDCEKNRLVALGELEEKFPIIYFVNSRCLDCDLQYIVQELNREHSKNSECCVIFSIYSSKAEIMRLSNQIKISTFIDVEDTMQIMDLIIDERQKIISFDRSDINRGMI